MIITIRPLPRRQLGLELGEEVVVVRTNTPVTHLITSLPLTALLLPTTGTATTKGLPHIAPLLAPSTH